MSSRSFVVQKEVGREFEKPMMKVLEEKGFRVIDVDSWSYRLKKGRDIIVEYQGQRASIEFKFDKLSEKTGRVCLDWDSMSKTESKYWIYGLPEGDKIAVYAMYASQLRDFALAYVRSHPESMKRVGEFKQYCAMIPKPVFISQPFISKFGTIEIS
jgi:hypothetical protein